MAIYERPEDQFHTLSGLMSPGALEETARKSFTTVSFF